MPRIYTSASDPLDFCSICFPLEDEAYELYGSLGNGPDGRGNCFGYDSEHPDYSKLDYRCCICEQLLEEEDN